MYSQYVVIAYRLLAYLFMLSLLHFWRAKKEESLPHFSLPQFPYSRGISISCYVPGTALRVVHVLAHLIFTTTLTKSLL